MSTPEAQDMLRALTRAYAAQLNATFVAEMARIMLEDHVRTLELQVIEFHAQRQNAEFERLLRK